MVNGPSWNTGLMSIVIVPIPALRGITASMMPVGGGGSCLQHPISLARAEPLDGIPLIGEPRGERVGTKMSLHHEIGDPTGRHPAQPRLEQLVQRLLAQAHRGIAVHR